MVCRVVTLWMLITSMANGQPASAAFRFENRIANSGVEFVHFAGRTKQQYIHETVGGGVACFDFDLDGVLDLYFAQGKSFPFHESTLQSELYHGLGDFRFTRNMPQLSTHTGYGMGVTVADSNNDGFPDLYATNFGPNVLYHNNGDGTFHPVRQQAVLETEFSTAACWLDFDRDGMLDLFISNYVDCDFDAYPSCLAGVGDNKQPVTCRPTEFPGQQDRLFRNLGDGNFADVSEEMGIHVPVPERGLGVVACDLNQDGWIDLYVANDMGANHLFLNSQGKFTECGVAMNAAFNRHGAFEAGMGVAVGDLDGDHLPELFVTNYAMETNTLYRNEGEFGFLDVTDECGLAHTSLKMLGFATGFCDFDNDRWLDIYVANGHIHDEPSLQLQRLAQLSKMSAQVWRNNQTGSYFHEVSEHAGEYFKQVGYGRGAAFGDLNNDGRLDVVATHLDEPPAILKNCSENENQFLMLSLVGKTSNRDAIGARITVHMADQTLVRWKTSGESYLASHDHRVHIGIGVGRVDRLEIDWPAGTRSTLTEVSTNRSIIAVEPNL